MKNQQPPQRHSKSKKKQFDAEQYARYSSLAFQLIATVLLGFIAGYFTDKLFHLSLPIFKLLFSLCGVVLGLYLLMKEVGKKD